MKPRILFAAAGVAVLLGAAVAMAQTISVPLQVPFGTGNLIQVTPGGIASTKATYAPVSVYVASLTPAASTAAIQTTEQTFTVTGLTTDDVVFVNGPVPTSLCPPVHARVSAANTLAIAFSTLTASACTPAAGTYNIFAIR